jgi:hypothetical protein
MVPAPYAPPNAAVVWSRCGPARDTPAAWTVRGCGNLFPYFPVCGARLPVATRAPRGRRRGVAGRRGALAGRKARAASIVRTSNESALTQPDVAALATEISVISTATSAGQESARHPATRRSPRAVVRCPKRPPDQARARLSRRLPEVRKVLPTEPVNVCLGLLIVLIAQQDVTPRGASLRRSQDVLGFSAQSRTPRNLADTARNGSLDLGHRPPLPRLVGDQRLDGSRFDAGFESGWLDSNSDSRLPNDPLAGSASS